MGIDAEILVRGVPKDKVTDEWLKEMSWQLCRSIGARKFFINTEEGRTAISRTEQCWRENEGDEPGSIYYEDSDDPIKANDDECLLNVNVWTRYYGVGYERGDILTLCAIAEWLETNIPECTVHYGGDSSGVLAEPWTEEKRRALRNHLYSIEGRSYFSSWCQRDEFGLPPACSLCPGGVYQGWRGGAGRDFASFNCGGCGKSTETRDAGNTWQELKSD